jgi:hypothetical protein
VDILFDSTDTFFDGIIKCISSLNQEMQRLRLGVQLCNEPSNFELLVASKKDGLPKKDLPGNNKKKINLGETKIIIYYSLRQQSADTVLLLQNFLSQREI